MKCSKNTRLIVYEKDISQVNNIEITFKKYVYMTLSPVSLVNPKF
jgi:hypothetical protein